MLALHEEYFCSGIINAIINAIHDLFNNNSNLVREGLYKLSHLVKGEYFSDLITDKLLTSSSVVDVPTEGYLLVVTDDAITFWRLLTEHIC